MQFNSKANQDIKNEIDERFKSILDDAKPAYSIPKEAFENYHVKRGLREAKSGWEHAAAAVDGRVSGSTCPAEHQ